MDNFADRADTVLEDTVRARIGDHQGRQLVLVQLGLGVEVGQVDVAGPVAADDDDAVAGHDGAGRVSTVGAARDEADVAMAVAAGLMVAADGEEAGVLALATGVGLERDRCKAGDAAQPTRQPLGERGVASCLLGGREGMDVGKARSVTGIISAVAFSFIVQDPNGIMLRFSATSLSSSRLR